MATLTPIFDKMPNGGTAIQKNLESLNTETVANTKATKDTGWKSLSVASTASANATFVPKIRRNGREVTFQGAIGTKGTTAHIFDVPVGYLPTADVHIDLPMQSGNLTEIVRIYVKTNGSADVVASASVDKPFFLEDLSWPTDDDFPD